MKSCNCNNFKSANKKSLSNHRRWCVGKMSSGPFLGRKHSIETRAILRAKSLGDKNPNWKGKEVGLVALHSWVKRRLIKQESCQDCGSIARLDLANISQKYKRDISDWEWICRKCHMNKDGRSSLLSLAAPRIKVRQYDKQDNLIAEFESIIEAARQTGILRTNIQNVICGWTHTAGGYV